MGKFIKSLFGNKEHDVIYVPSVENIQGDLPKENEEKKPEAKLEEAIKTINQNKEESDIKTTDILEKDKQEEQAESDNKDKKEEDNKDKKEEKKDLKSYFFKETVRTSMTIFLIEDSKETYLYNDEIVKLANRSIGENVVCIIHYGEEIENPGIYFPGQADQGAIICLNEKGTKVSYYDAIIELEKVIGNCWLRTVESETKKYSIEDIEIVGFGTGRDNSSKTSKEDAYKAFESIATKSHVTNKYFCLTEDSFIDLASIGFHSIGRIKTNF